MRFLIIKTSSLGDIIHTFPTISYLKNRFPSSKIDWIVEKPFFELVRSHPNIHQIFCSDTRSWRRSFAKMSTFYAIQAFCKQLKSIPYDAVFDLQGNIKSGLMTSQTKSSAKVGFSFKTVPEWPNLLFTHTRFSPPPGQNIRDDYLRIVQRFFKDNHLFEEEGVILNCSTHHINLIANILTSPELARPYKLMICPGSIWPNKQLPTKTLIHFLERVQQQISCSFMFIWGSEGERQEALHLQHHFPSSSIVIDKLPIAALQNLMHRVSLVVGMDSLPLHLAGTTSTPTYSIFGSSSSNKYKPKGDQHRAFQGLCPYNKTFEKRCPILRSCATGSCIRSLDSEDIFQHFISWFIPNAIRIKTYS